MTINETTATAETLRPAITLGKGKIMTSYTATYDPADNKLRLYATSRLDAQTYERVKTAGFKWAPKQELFVAPMWTPDREDLCIELAGEVGDEDTSLVERAEERAERFEDLSERRTEEAHQARAAVSAIADNIPFGQPILVGHHSERHARKDAERIENGMRKTIRLWDQAGYWQSRAAGALRHAKYKERPDVRHRRIKTLGAEMRKEQRHMAELESGLTQWNQELDAEMVGTLLQAGWDFASPLDKAYRAGEVTAEQVIERKRQAHVVAIARSKRWIAHYENRIAYETAMLDEQLGTETDSFANRFDYQVGGRVLVKGEWLVILKVNKSQGVINSLTTTPPRVVTWTKRWKHGVEEISDYQPPTEEIAAKVKKATKLPPICNYPGEGFREMTEAEWSARKKWSDFSYLAVVSGPTVGKHRIRQMPGKPNYWQAQQVFITDAKVVNPPAPEPTEEPLPTERVMTAEYAKPAPKRPDEGMEAIRQALKTGVKVAVAPQLFPTPPEIARQMIELAEIKSGQRVLEPSAGTGNLLDAIQGSGAEVVAVERNLDLCVILRRKGTANKVEVADFLELNSELGTFDRVVMNPPFEKGADIKHIEHALTMLKPGGRLVAICANGPRQQEKLKPLASEWTDLPEDSFKDQGTRVNTAMLVIQK